MADAPGPLDGIRVIDLAGESGLFAGRLLGELGADVIRVEPPEGDGSRRRRPFLTGDLGGEPGVERSLYHQHFNAFKRGVTLDLQTDEGIERLRALAATADVLIETAAPGAMDALGAGYESLRALNRDLLYVTLTPFGQDGPFRDYRGNDLIGVATSGLMYLNGYPEDPPNQPGAEQAYHMGSLVAASATLIALVGRDRDAAGGGRRIDVSMQEAASMATLQTANANIYTWHGDIPRRIGLIGPLGGRGLFQCRDGGWIQFTVPLGVPALWDAFAQWMVEEGVAGPIASEQWRDPAYRAQHPQVSMGVIAALAAKYDRAELFHEGQRRRILVMPVNDAGDLVADEHLRERGFYSTVDQPALGRELTDVGAPCRLSVTPAVPLVRAPRLAEHNDEVFAELAEREARPAATTAAAAVSGGSNGRRALPLAGLRVADFFWLIAGPSTSRVLADYGADVIKIESEARVDNIRSIGVQPSQPGSIDTNGVFNDTNTNKRSVQLNLGDPRGIELAKEIVRHSDIVTNNFTGDRMDRWGLGYEELKKVKPDIIMLTMPVMGTSGPYRRYGSYGNGVIAYGGMSMNMGFPGRAPTGIAPLYSDFSTPYFAVSALMAALHHRERTGEGQFIELAQMEATVNLLGTDILEYTANGDLPPRPGNRSRDYCPHGAYRCAGEDRWCAIAVASDEDWRLLCAAIDRPELAADERFASAEARRAHEDAIDDVITAWTRDRDAWDVMRTLQGAGVIAGVVEDLEDMVTRDPGLSTRHLLAVERPGEGFTFTTHAQPSRMDGETPPLRRAPYLGEHNEEVYKGLLGLSAERFVELLAEQVIY